MHGLRLLALAVVVVSTLFARGRAQEPVAYLAFEDDLKVEGDRITARASATSFVRGLEGKALRLRAGDDSRDLEPSRQRALRPPGR